MPTEIFVHQRLPADPRGDTYADEFVFIASAFDIASYPIDEPDPSQSPMYFRKDYCDVVVASQSMADEFWDAIKQEVCFLKNTYDSMDVLTVAETFVCGEDSEEGDSEEGDSEESE